LIKGTLPVNMIAELTGVCQPTHITSSPSPVDQSKQAGPLSIWTNMVAELTGLDTEDFTCAYAALVSHLD
jgi:hypothetical protein